ERGLHLIDNRFESGLIGNREVRKNLAIKADVGRFQTFRETTVGETLRADSGIEPLHPEHTEVALAGLAVAVGPVFCLHRRVFRVTEEFRSATPVTFGGFQDALAALAAGGRVGGSWHVVVPRILSGSSLSEWLFLFRSPRPHSLIRPALVSQDQVDREFPRNQRSG